MRSLLRRIELQRARDVASEQGRSLTISPRTDANGAAVLLAGDFNFDRSSDLYAVLSQGCAPHSLRAKAREQLASLDHPLLPLRDAYATSSPLWGPPLRATYRNGRLLDYVWTSAAVELLRSMPVSELAASTQPRHMPSATMPSDHLPVGALFTWAGAPKVHPALHAKLPAWQQLSVENVQPQRRS